MASTSDRTPIRSNSPETNPHASRPRSLRCAGADGRARLTFGSAAFSGLRPRFPRTNFKWLGAGFLPLNYFPFNFATVCGNSAVCDPHAHNTFGTPRGLYATIVKWPSINIAANGEAAVFLPGLGAAMVCFTKRLQVARIPEERCIASVWLDMIGHRCPNVLASIQTEATEGLCLELGRSLALPSARGVPTAPRLGCLASSILRRRHHRPPVVLEVGHFSPIWFANMSPAKRRRMGS
jgi:hypothetical protein